MFGHWRVAITRALRATHALPPPERIDRWLQAVRSLPLREGVVRWLTAVWDFVARPEEIVTSADPQTGRLPDWTGYGCLAMGTALVAIVTLRSGAGAVAAVTDAVILVVWAAARYAVMRLAADRDLRANPRAIHAAWAGGLMPFAFAGGPILETAALAASAWRALRAASGSARKATLVAGAAFGGQAAVEVIAWIVRGGLIYAVLLGR